MKFLRGICRFIVGLTFTLSGVLKLIDPTGTGLIVDEYLAFMHLGFLKQFSVALGMGLSGIEFITGICLLAGIRTAFFSLLALIIISGFTLLTLYLAVFNPISDCGCFGEAVHLSNWETFVKNIILLLCTLTVYVNRNKYRVLAHRIAEWAIAVAVSALTVMTSLNSYFSLPLNDFTLYSPGADLNSIAESKPDYVTTFIYSKDGVEEEFTLDNLPDSTWTFVDSRTTLPEDSAEAAQVDLTLRDTQGGDHTSILYADGAMIAAVVWDTDGMNDAKWDRIEQLRETSREANLPMHLFSIDDNVPENMDDILLLADRKALMTLVRNNGGAVLINGGVIVKKWPSIKIAKEDVSEVLAEDPDVTILHDKMKVRAFNTANILGTIFLVILIRYFCGAFRRKPEKLVNAVRRRKSSDRT